MNCKIESRPGGYEGRKENIMKINYDFDLRSDGTVKNARWTINSNENAYYCTNSDGDGLFRVEPQKNKRLQLRGTCDFSVFGLKPSSARAKIRAQFSD